MPDEPEHGREHDRGAQGHDRGAQEHFPSSKLERGKIIAKTGLKIGGNYARYLARKAVSSGSTDQVARKKALHEKNAKDLYREFTKLRGTALKLAQGMSMDTGVLPVEFAEVMSQAQYRVPPMNRALVRRIIKEALGDDPETLFAHFEPEAMAAASIGQVHRARLHDGREVVVKVQYPNIRETIRSDLTIARGIFKRLIKGDNVEQYFEEVKQTLFEETDYENEARQLAFFADRFDRDEVVTPRAVPELTRINVLTMTYVEGVHLDAFLAGNPSQERINHFGQLLWDFVHEQVAGNLRTVHADVHPGNFLFREDGRLGVIDFGCVKTFPQDFRDRFLWLFRAQINRDEALMRRLYEEVEILRPGADPESQATLFDFFHRFGEIVLRPYREVRFDFGDPAFKKDLNRLFREATNFNEVAGSRHFVFVNKILAGLFAVLFQLKPHIDASYSIRLLNEAVDDIEARIGV